MRRSVACFLLLSPLVAQAVDPVHRAAGVIVHEGHVRGFAAGYSARFDPDGMTFVPALGKAVAAPRSLQFTTTELQRGASIVWRRGADAAPRVVGDTVRYEHSATLSEAYDVRAEGIEQSFVLAARPPGSGDLVVRGRIRTDLPLASAGDDGVQFVAPAVGGVSFGAVTGIDANGARARGGLRLVGDVLELRLPAAFVDAATYPLVLDPLVGAVFTVGNVAGGADAEPAVAFDASTGRYLVVWNVHLSATVAEVRAQLVSATGALVGNQLLLSSSGDPAERPVVANVNVSDRFLVAYMIRTTAPSPTGPVPVTVLKAVAVSAGTGALSNEISVAGGLFQVVSSQPAIGGESDVLGMATALIAYRVDGINNGIVGARVRVLSTGTPTLLGSTTLATSANHLGDPAVSAHTGSHDRWLVVFGQSIVSPTAPFTRLYGQLIDINGALCGVQELLRNAGAGGDLRTPTVATPDGATFAVAWQDAIAQRLELRMAAWSGSCAAGSWSTGLLQYPVVQAGPASSPALAFAKDKFVLAWSQNVASIAKVYCKGLDPTTCASCGAELRTDTTLNTDETPAVASRWQGGNAGSDEALVAWSNGTIRARRFEARGADSVTSLGGGCFLGALTDYATYSGHPVLGDSTFAVELLAPTAPIAALVVGFSAVQFPCGSCTLVPSLDLVLAGVTPTPVPIPCQPGLIGTDLYAQWLLLRPSDCPLVPFVATSNTLKFTIGE